MPLTPFLAQKLNECRQLHDLGTSPQELVEMLHDQGLSVMEVSQVVGGILGLETEEAHVFVADSPVWVEVIEQSTPVIDQIMQVLDRDGDVEVMSDGSIVYRELLVAEHLVPPPG